MAKADKPVIVKQDGEAPIATEVLASAIVQIAAATKRALNSGLSRRALLVLLKDASNVPQYHIERVLNAMEQLQDTYVVKKRK